MSGLLIQVKKVHLYNVLKVIHFCALILYLINKKLLFSTAYDKFKQLCYFTFNILSLYLKNIFSYHL